MSLLSAVEDAVLHESRKVQFAAPMRIIEDLGWREQRTLSRSELRDVRAAMRAVGPDFTTWHDERLYRQVTDKAPAEDVPLFAAFLFRRRAPKFARGLVTTDGMAALVSAVASWSRPKGRPKKGDTTLPKWDACDALMKAAGLVGTARDSLQKDWEEWNARRNNKGG
jgi:hypothetical protein